MSECKIVQDLLPLYGEDLIAPETKNYVVAHCAGCEDCARLLRRCEEPCPPVEIDAKQYRKAFLKSQINLLCKAVAVFALLFCLMYITATKLDSYVKWKEGRTPVEQVIEAPTGNGKVTLVDWEASGRRIGNARNEGTLIYIEQKHVYEDEWGVGISMSEGGMAKPWENVQVVWSPSGEEIFLKADLLDGGYGMFVHTYDHWRDEKGGSHGVSKLLPDASGNGFVDMLRSACEEHEDFPTGWKNVDFSFYEWKADSETIVFVYETDNGYRGLLDYHFPTETITDLD